MFSRHLIAAAALMVATCAAHADAISTTSIAADMSIVDTSTSLTGANSGLASILAAPNTNSKLVLVRGVEGLYMLASRATAADAAQADGAAAGAGAGAVTGAGAGAVTGGGVDIIAADPVTSIDTPVVNAADVPEPATLALMLAGVLGAVGFTRARKQG
jgi:hypothetical protein